MVPLPPEPALLDRLEPFFLLDEEQASGAAANSSASINFE
jgi:hypothetical protein